MGSGRIVPRAKGHLSSSAVVLIVATRRWHFPSRLALALQELGVTVDIICPARHSALVTTAVKRRWRYHSLWPLRSIRRAIRSSSPDLIIPCDDSAALHLHQICALTRNDALRSLITKSIGPLESFSTTASRFALQGLAHEVGVQVPRSFQIDSLESLDEAISQTGLPAFLKSEGSSGGTGVKMVRTLAEARHALSQLSAPPGLVRAIKRTTINSDRSMMLAATRRLRPQISLQQHIDGSEANCTIFAWKGAILSRNVFQVVRASRERGPSTVLRRIDHAMIEEAVAKIAARLELSGIFGFDFMLSAKTGEAYLIELNPRATPVSHLALGPGRDVPAAILAILEDREVTPRPLVTKRREIALFPGEWQRDQDSPFLTSAYHDVPTQSSELVRLCMQQTPAWHDWFTYSAARRMMPWLKSGHTINECEPEPPLVSDAWHDTCEEEVVGGNPSRKVAAHR